MLPQFFFYTLTEAPGRGKPLFPFSGRKAPFFGSAALRKARIAATAVGSILDGQVESLQPYGAFIDLGDGISGLVHVSQISSKRVKSPDAVLSVGQDVKVKVSGVEKAGDMDEDLIVPDPEEEVQMLSKLGDAIDYEKVRNNDQRFLHASSSVSYS